MKSTLIFCSAVLCLLASCNNGPKIIKTSNDGSSQPTGIFANAGSENAMQDGTRVDDAKQTMSNDLHQIKVLETLPTSKYIYLRVNEEDKEYWVATRKMDVEVGASYFFRGGLLKTNFESKEYDRIFETLYLVSNLVPANHAQGNTEKQMEPTEKVNQTEKQTAAVSWPVAKEIKDQSMSIKELVENKAELEGEIVQLTGRCTKINPNIMGRNWIHLKDGSLDEYDLVLTSDVAVPEGHEITVKGTVTLNRDFGAGYTYDLLIENAELVR